MTRARGPMSRLGQVIDVDPDVPPRIVGKNRPYRLCRPPLAVPDIASAHNDDLAIERECGWLSVRERAGSVCDARPGICNRVVDIDRGDVVRGWIVGKGPANHVEHSSDLGTGCVSSRVGKGCPIAPSRRAVDGEDPVVGGAGNAVRHVPADKVQVSAEQRRKAGSSGCGKRWPRRP